MLWVATAENGVFGIRDDRIWHHFEEGDGLLSNRCQKLYADQDQYLWLATRAGVNQIDLKTLAIQSIDRSDGLLYPQVNDLIRAADQLWLATPQGLFSLPVKTNYRSPQEPIINLTKFKIWNRDTSLHPQYTLSHTKNNLQIEFQGIYFKRMCVRCIIVFKYLTWYFI